MNLLKTILSALKSFFSSPFNAAKAKVVAEIDKAIVEIPTKGVETVVEVLEKKIDELVARAKLPEAASLLIRMLVASVDWKELARKSAQNAVEELKRLRSKVEGARL